MMNKNTAHMATNLASQLCIIDSPKTTLTNLISQAEVISSLGKFFIRELYWFVHSYACKTTSSTSWFSIFIQGTSGA